MATKTVVPDAPVLVLPEGTLLVGTADGINTQAFTVGPGVVTVDISGDVVTKVAFHYGARIESILEDGQITRGVLAEGRRE